MSSTLWQKLSHMPSQEVRVETLHITIWRQWKDVPWIIPPPLHISLKPLCFPLQSYDYFAHINVSYIHQ
jgi:hypothetical protein